MSAKNAPTTYRKALLFTASAVALLGFAPGALAQTAPTRLESLGAVTPTDGDIEAFDGDINAFFGTFNPFDGDINAFDGDINAFDGDINAFDGDINAFDGDINAFADPFWGSTNPFNRTSNPLNLPEYSAVGTFWHDVGPSINAANTTWRGLGSYSSDQAGYASVKTSIDNLITSSQTLFGAAVTAKTGQTFQVGFVDPLLAKYGINLANNETLAGLTDTQRSMFFLDWYDGLMNYSGADHLDYWMPVVNWRPSITQVQGMGSGTIIGLLDASVAGDPDILNNITSAQGYTNTLNAHGASVASLMVANIDGQGVMGIAPNASVVSYNPFDSSGTAGWSDIQDGITALQSAGASVVNMSLGVSGWTLHGDWKNTLSNVNTSHTVFVVAAGNAGVAQSTDIEWNWTQNPAMIVVGSVGPTGEISSFSNRPGSACLLDSGVCSSGHHLYDRFMVAPGEVILVSDGAGGLERRSGTSFSAPLVSGAIALLHDRWPWLANYPQETVDIILRSAKDLGAPGPDAVYGRGLLDVEASQSPLDMSALTFYEYKNGVSTQKTAAQVKSAGTQTTWEADGVFFYLYENIGQTHRDFAVPLSSSLVGQKTSVGGSSEYYQGYITSRLLGWISSTGFTDVTTHVAQQPGQWSFAVSTSAPQAPWGGDDLASQAPHMAFRMADPTGKFAFTAGRGQGAMVLGQMDGFAMTQDYTSAEGGVNPLLGFASGGPFASVDVALSKRTTLSIGGAERRLEHDKNPAINALQRNMLRNVDDYEAGALNLRLSHKVTDALTLSAGYARLKEANGLLGVQSQEADDLGRGSVSDTATVGASLALPHGLTLAGSASAGKSRTAGDQNLATVGNVATTAWAVAFEKQGLFGKNDRLRLTLTQPLAIQHGSLAYTSVQVIDRTTGEIGPVTQTFDIAVKPRHVAETVYATPVFEGQGQLTLFGRAEMQSDHPVQDYMVGARLNLNY